MNLLFINQYAWPDHAASAQMLDDLSVHAVEAGHHVRVLASRAAYGNGSSHLARETHRGVQFERVGATGLGRATNARRMVDYLSFYALALARSMTGTRPDVVVSLTTPPLIGLVGTVLSATRSVAHVVWCMDVYPDLAVRLGTLTGAGPLHGVTRRIASYTLRHAHAVMVLGDDMAHEIRRRGVAAERLHVTRNWADGDSIRPLQPGRSRLRQSLGLPESTVLFGYMGNFGRAHTFAGILEIAHRRRADDRIRFLFVGDGPQREEVEGRARELGLVNVIWRPPQPRESLGDCLAAVDVHLVSQAPSVDGLLVPSKLYGALAAGRPILFLGSPTCEVGQTVLDAGCGLVADPSDVDAIDGAVEQLVSDGITREEMGRRARARFEHSYDKRVGCQRALNVIEQVVRPPHWATAAPPLTSSARPVDG